MIENEIPNSNLKISAHSLSVFQSGMTEMLNLLSSEIVKICDETKKSTVTSPMIVEAVTNLGFSEYEDELKEFVEGMLSEEKKRKRKKKESKRGKGEVEQQLMDEQERLMKEARDRLYGHSHPIDNNMDNGWTIKQKQENETDSDGDGALGIREDDADDADDTTNNGFQLSLP